MEKMSTKQSMSLTNKIDIGSFIDRWWSQKNLSYQAEIRDWMMQSYEEPFIFWNALFKYYQEMGGEIQSQPLKSYNFYHDCVLKHLRDNPSALTIVHPDQQTETYTYYELHQLIETQTAVWREKFKVEAGQTIAMIFPQGIHLLVSLMTALRLGLSVCLLPLKDPFLGSDHLLSALKQLNPDYIATSIGTPWLDTNPIAHQSRIIDVDLSIKKTVQSSPPPHLYSAHDIVIKVFDPYRLRTKKMTLIDANTAYACSIRNGIFALPLKLGTQWIRPLSSIFNEEPLATLTALLAGATMMYVPEHVLRSDPYRLKKESIEVIEISASLRDLWTRYPGCPSEKLKLWYKNPLVGNIHEWTAFSEQNKLQTVPTTNLITDPAKGGFIVFSQPKPIKDLFLIHPSLGTPWALLHPNGSGEKSFNNYGIFQHEPLDAQDGYLIMAQIGDDWVIQTTTVPIKNGIPYPVQQIEKAIEELDFVEMCMILPHRSTQGTLSHSFVLILFLPPKSRSLIETHRENWSYQIRSIIEQNIGEVFVPETIVFYSLYPKMKQGAIDRNWVQMRYESGWLARQERNPAYHALNLLRQSVYEKLTHPMP